jgi:hypothetical protein
MDSLGSSLTAAAVWKWKWPTIARRATKMHCPKHTKESMASGIGGENADQYGGREPLNESALSPARSLVPPSLVPPSLSALV